MSPKKRNPEEECLKVFPVSMEEIVDLCAIVYKEVKEKSGFKLSDYHVNKILKQQKHFRNFTMLLLSLIYEIRPDAELNTIIFIRLCKDYFEALEERYSEFKKDGASHFGGIANSFAMETFQSFCIEEYGSIEDYLGSIIPKKKSHIIKIPKAIITGIFHLGGGIIDWKNFIETMYCI